MAMNRMEVMVSRLVEKYLPEKSASILELCPGEGHLTRAMLGAGHNNLVVMDINPQNFKVSEVE